jgi:hypothetical protein
VIIAATNEEKPAPIRSDLVQNFLVLRLYFEMTVSELKREVSTQKFESVWSEVSSSFSSGKFAYQGERVLGFAYKTFKGEKDTSVYQKDDSSLLKENL